MENKIPAYNDVFSLVQRIFEVTSNVPKEQHNDMVEMLLRSGSELMRSLVRACKISVKELYLEPLWADFDILKMEILTCGKAGLLHPETHRELDMLVHGIEQKWAPLGYPPTKPRP